ncbi:MAG: undecaprenyldiphospho-muramoylpentapeptide beta-N-acetylglucosaminyltransferase [Deltaproteobacteria bacterium]|nr:undecaprenyldiphospho-muramoylpentapeptide beta-N-acetylglucosaminyltransferase [Deltaproteobacteria bacterium]MBW1950108.1 undecaprenyldiphospho-muramoylpentapeptide beta-N-acetylglucosaminyltransferase [Deltaproteobacteria bacterium]MBW2009565.1 undecaprenyldiphospho-muramoylpentapeptide beta-N-acetylglucosaminyltransferase [Deltaproteobacteria bacterium]MBW2103639.1 undecaprenyldiphospho-muramoylpentapeptide beta-N-acetylglucosaminyltransferase [Deltaproteobacteria bacterium]MBW2347623.1 
MVGAGTKKSPKVVIAGGGTGGHIFPGIAVAREFKRRFPQAEVLFVVGQKEMEAEIVRRHGFPYESLNVEGIKGRGWLRALAVGVRLPGSVIRSAAMIGRLDPDVVLGMGAYSSGPLCLAACLRGVPTAIHEQNSTPGLTNRILAPWVRRTFVSFEESIPLLRARSIEMTGNPVREELLGERTASPRPKGTFRLLVVGGSQGARAVNSAFVEALALLKGEGWKPGVLHQAGPGDYETVAKAYEDRGLEGRVVPFIEDMGRAYQEADLVISRAGATTIAELAALGKPSVLVPYPYAANRHQDTNARALADVGGAEVIPQEELDGPRLARCITRYMKDPEALRAMGACARAKGKPEAARLIVDRLLEMIS